MRSSPANASALVLSSLVLSAGIALAQQPNPSTRVKAPKPAKPQAAPEPWRFAPTFGVFAEYDDNVFLLAPAQRSRIATPPAGSPPSRFANMERVSDIVTKVRAELPFSGPGVGGRTLAVTPELKYDYYAANAERRSVQLGLSAAHNLGGGSRIRVQGEMSPSTFFKNYLSNAVDADLNGSISRSERVYAPGSYAERLIAADYRFRLKKSTKASPMAAFVQAGAGHYGRTYDAPFARRDQSGPIASLGLILDRGRVEFEAGYDFASLGATPGRAVLLLDEPVFGVDFNGNGNATDLSARAFEMVDHSRTEHGVNLIARMPVGARSRLELDYSHRRRSFGSKQPYDVSNNGRKDARNEVAGELAIKLAHSVRLLAGFAMQRQVVNKALDAVGEVADYSRQRATIGLRYQY